MWPSRSRPPRCWPRSPKPWSRTRGRPPRTRPDAPPRGALTGAGGGAQDDRSARGAPVSNRLMRLSLPWRLDGPKPGLAAQLGVAVAMLTAVAASRLAIEAVAPGVAPFSLLYPAILAATLLAGWG